MILGIGKKAGRRRGLTFKVLVVVPFCIALALQGVVCVAVLAGSRTLEQMEVDAYDLFSERVSSRAGYLENDMIFRWSDFDMVSASVGDRIDKVLAERGAAASDVAAGSDLALSLIDASSEDMISFARRAEIDGVYLVLANGTGGAEDAHSALYIRDSNPKIEVANGSDLLLAACPISVGRRLDIALDSQWSATFALAAEGEAQSAFFYRPLRAAELYPAADTKDLGYWGRPVDLGWAGTQSVTYSKPLRDAAGAVIGVLGVEVRLDRIASFFPYRDLGDAGSGSYLLAVTGEEGGFARDGGVAPLGGRPRSYSVLAATGASQSLYVDEGSLTAALDDKGRLAVEAASASSDARAIASAAELALYDSTSPFASEHWALIGLEREGELFSASRALSDNLVKVFAVSIVVGLVIAVLTAWVSSSRLRNLMREVRAASPEQPISFTPTGIVEVDELSEAIELLGTEVAGAASRLSQILKLSDRSIAAFECNLEARTVSYTDGFFDTVGIVGRLDRAAAERAGVAAVQGGTMALDRFEQLFEPLKDHFEQESSDRWVVSDSAELRWLRIVTVASSDNIRLFGLVEDATDEIATRRRIEHERDHDVLTGLLNRRAFEQEVTARLASDPPAFAVMLMLDLDNLKYINDTYGHDWGDHYIKAAGRVIEATFAGEGIFARISGDEFLVFADRCNDADGARLLFERFMNALDTSVLDAPDSSVLKVRASVGVAFYPEDALDFGHLREYADYAMYEAKNHRKGALLRFDPKSHEEGSFILSNKEDLNRLLDENLIDYHFQPIVDAHAGEVVAYEALMRPRLASIATPDRVLLLARSQSKLYRVEHLTFFGALEAFSQHEVAGRPVLFVNSIATQRLSSDDEVDLRQRFGPLLKRLVIEITESEYSREMALYKEGLAQRWGARLAIDDFGSGYNGETSLLDYHVDFVKLDMGIVRDIDSTKDRRDIAQNLIGYAHDRGIRVIAEGVETEAELATVIDIGADYVQGYLCARPASEPLDISDDVKRLIRSLGERRAN